MSKNISIKEDKQSRNFTSKKLKIAAQSDGSSLWVPKDEVKLKTLSIRTPGIYQAWVDEAYGYSKVNVSGLRKGSDTKRTDKSVTENGTYKAEDDHFYAYNTFTVNVPGGGGTAPASDKPGSSVYGTYPDGTQTTVSVDNEGNLVKSGLAEYILLDTPPTKLKYKDGERILLGGAVVRGYLANGTPYKNASYQDSILPMTQTDTEGDEIPGGVVFPSPLYADASQAEGGGGGASSDLDTLIPQPIPFRSGNMSFSGPDTLEGEIEADEGAHYVILQLSGYDDKRKVIFVTAKEPGKSVRSVSRWTNQGSEYTKTRTFIVSSSYTYNGKTVYFSTNVPNSSISLYRTPYIEPDVVINSFEGRWQDAWTIEYGTASAGDTQTITLNWPREGDRKILTTTYEIEVTP